jgi:hypothetical protein
MLLKKLRPVNGKETKKARQNATVLPGFQRVANGARTRDLQIHNLAL